MIPPSLTGPGPVGRPHQKAVRGCGPGYRRAPKCLYRFSPPVSSPAGQSVLVDPTEDVIEQLLARCRRDHAAWINGDASGYVLPDDASLMGAMGGTSRGGERMAQRQRYASSMWESGSGDVELVAGGVHADVAWLVMIEQRPRQVPRAH